MLLISANQSGILGIFSSMSALFILILGVIWLIYTFQENQKLGTDRKKYKTNMITITIHENNSTIMTIARKSLKINYYPSSYWDFKSKYCSIVDDLFIHIFNNEIKKITDKNLL